MLVAEVDVVLPVCAFTVGAEAEADDPVAV
jgi:hypothetical protein